MITIHELIQSREETVPIDPIERGSAVTRWVILADAGEDEEAAKALLKATTPEKVNELTLRDHHIKPISVNAWFGTAQYGQRAVARREFDTTGGRVNIRHALKQTRYKDDGTSEDDPNKAINVDKDGRVRGTEIIIPAMSFNETHEISSNIVTDSWIRDVRDLTGKVNDAQFRGHEPGEVLFRGVQGSNASDDLNWELTFFFLAGKNLTADTTLFDGFTITKKAHDYLHVRWKSKQENPNELIVQAPRDVLVGETYEEDDFGILTI